VTAGFDATARIWDVASGGELVVVRGHTGPVRSARFSPDSRTLATGGDDGVVRTWDVRTGAALHTFAGHTDWIYDLAWSDDARTLASASQDGTLRLWPAEGGPARLVVHAHSGFGVRAIAFLPEHDKLVSAGGDGVLRVWNVATGAEIVHFSDHDAPYGLALDPRGIRAASPVLHEGFEIWDTRDGKKLIDLVGHVGQGLTASWSPDGEMIITSGTDGTARIWDVATGDTIAIFSQGHEMRAASFSPDGARVITAADDGTAAIRELPRQVPSGPELERYLRCRVPYRIEGDQPIPVVRDRAACRRGE
jgi:WD40 repeat protein